MCQQCVAGDMEGHAYLTAPCCSLTSSSARGVRAARRAHADCSSHWYCLAPRRLSTCSRKPGRRSSGRLVCSFLDAKGKSESMVSVGVMGEVKSEVSVGVMGEVSVEVGRGGADSVCSEVPLLG